MESIEKHIEADRKQLNDGNISPQRRRHIEDELEQLEAYHEKHPNDHHDPTSLELYCDANPSEPECKFYDA
jgi:hypothetical protein